MKNFKYIFLLIFAISCNPKRIDTSQMLAEMKNVEVKRITAPQIVAFANEWGNEIVKKLNSNNADIKSLEQEYKVKISKIDLLNTVLQNLDPKEKQIIEASQYSLNKNISIGPNLQALRGGEIQLFTAPVLSEKNSLWRVEFTKKEIIRKASVKEIKKMTTR